MKRDFIESEIWLLTIGGGFQRANVYINGSTDKERSEFRNKLHGLVIKIAVEYNETVSETRHIDNIIQISKLKHSALNNGSMNFGVSQKILNLYLKYLWCLGEIPTPPHFPVDRIIQQKLKLTPVISWTQIDNPEKYLRIIAHAKKQADKENTSIAELELALFKRNSQSV